MKTVQKLLLPLLYITSIGTVWISANFPSYAYLLHFMTQENGFFESLSVLFLLAITAYGVYTLRAHTLRRYFRWLVGLFSGLTFLAAMEEISWGQQLFHFHSSAFFMKANLQHETNLHNLVDANLFSSVIYSSVYTLLVFMPLLVKFLPPTLLQRYHFLRFFDINPHTILVVLFASVFQIYFYDDFGVWMDMVTHLGALGLFGLYLIRKKSSIWLKLHYGFVLLATVISMASHEVYRFENMQYEIREMFVVLAVLLIFVEQIKKERNEKGSMDYR